jgi:hypothetical protein
MPAPAGGPFASAATAAAVASRAPDHGSGGGAEFVAGGGFHGGPQPHDARRRNGRLFDPAAQRLTEALRHGLFREAHLVLAFAWRGH